MSALTIAQVNNGANQNSSSQACNGYKVGLSMITDKQVTLTVQVSKDDSTWYDFVMAVDTTPTPVELVVPIGNMALVIDCSAWQYIRFNVANASGAATTTLALDVVLYKV